MGCIIKSFKSSYSKSQTVTKRGSPKPYVPRKPPLNRQDIPTPFESPTVTLYTTDGSNQTSHVWKPSRKGLASEDLIWSLNLFLSPSPCLDSVTGPQTPRASHAHIDPDRKIFSSLPAALQVAWAQPPCDLITLP